MGNVNHIDIFCPHCGKTIPSSVFFAKLGGVTSPQKAEAARKNGASGGRPRSQNPVRLRPYHPNHPRHAEWLIAQKKKAP